MGWVKRLSSSWAGAYAWSMMVSGTEGEYGETPGERLDDARTDGKDHGGKEGRMRRGTGACVSFPEFISECFSLKRASISLRCFKQWGRRLDGFCQGIPSSVGGLVGADHGQRETARQTVKQKPTGMRRRGPAETWHMAR